MASIPLRSRARLRELRVLIELGQAPGIEVGVIAAVSDSAVSDKHDWALRVVGVFARQ
jgi:hypothetical protein